MRRLRLLAAPLLVLLLALVLRTFVIEPSHIGHACDPAPWAGWCAPRTALIMAFRFQEIGWAALVLGILATLRAACLARHARAFAGPRGAGALFL